PPRRASGLAGAGSCARLCGHAGRGWFDVSAPRVRFRFRGSASEGGKKRMPRVPRDTRTRAPAGRAPRQLVVRDHPRNAETAPRALGAYLTSAADRFVRTNFSVPRLARRSHRLRVGGLVEQPLDLRMDELDRLPQRTLTVTTECAGNHRTTLSPLPPGEPWGGGAVSTARWTG